MIEKKFFIKPRVVVSKCLEFSACRYNGAKITDAFIPLLSPHVEFLPVCPEVEIGLGIPREPIRIVKKGEEELLVQPATGLDVTEKMNLFARSYLDSLKDIEGFILKGRSPSCGIKDVKFYGAPEKSPTLGKTSGLFAQRVMAVFPGLAIEDEGRLTNYDLRHHFLAKLFMLAHFREVKKKKSIQSLVQFHTENKLLLMSYHQTKLKEMGRIVASYQKDLSTLLPAYERVLHQALSKRPRSSSQVNVLLHAFGYFSNELASPEKKFFLQTLEKYRKQQTPIHTLLHLLGSWVVRFDEKYLASQTYFTPYPEELFSMKDSGKGENSLEKD